MNLFVLSKKPQEAAQAHGDKHVVKMILEACQMLYSAHWTASYPALLSVRSAVAIAKAHRLLDVPIHMLSAPRRKNVDESGFRPVHLHHPCTIWIRESLGNYMWAVELALALADEYEFRWPGKVHACRAHAEWLKVNLPPGRPEDELKGFAVAMDDEYKVAGDTVASYRKYYRESKKEKGLTVYTGREKPEFLNE
jgi:hypothetical protein